jgi:hypothetical protein
MMGPGAGGGLGLGKALSKGPAASAPTADDGGMTDGGLDIAAGDLMRAIERKDQAGVTSALRAAVMACQSTDYDNDGE